MKCVCTPSRYLAGQEPPPLPLCHCERLKYDGWRTSGEPGNECSTLYRSGEVLGHCKEANGRWIPFRVYQLTAVALPGGASTLAETQLIVEQFIRKEAL